MPSKDDLKNVKLHVGELNHWGQPYKSRRVCSENASQVCMLSLSLRTTLRHGLSHSGGGLYMESIIIPKHQTHAGRLSLDL